MNKAEKERLARRQRMLAREQGQAPEAGIFKRWFRYYRFYRSRCTRCRFI